MLLHRSLPAATLPGSGAAGTTTSGAAGAQDVPDSGAEDAAADGPDDGGIPVDDEEPKTLEEQRERLYTVLAKSGGASPEAIAKLRRSWRPLLYIGQGNPDASAHAMTRAECRKRRAEAKIAEGDAALCGGPNMVALFDPAAGEGASREGVRIDRRYEFPDIPREYPVVNVRANEAEALCRAVGKRLCDAHELEGACAGAVHAPETEYLFGEASAVLVGDAQPQAPDPLGVRAEEESPDLRDEQLQQRTTAPAAGGNSAARTPTLRVLRAAGARSGCTTSTGTRPST